MRPIVCCVGTFVNDWSKWLDYWLQQLKHLVPTYVKDSQQVLDDVKLINLPPNAKLFTCDAHSMYNNIKFYWFNFVWYSNCCLNYKQCG